MIFVPETISLKKAYQIVLEKTPAIKINKVLEYKDLFVFDIVSFRIGLIAVKKDTGDLFGFNPMYNDPDTFFSEWERNASVIKGVYKWSDSKTMN